MKSRRQKYGKPSNKPPGAYLKKRIFWWGRIRGEGLFEGGLFQSPIVPECFRKSKGEKKDNLCLFYNQNQPLANSQWLTIG